MKQHEAPQWLIDLISCIFNNWQFALAGFVLVAIYALKQKCEKNIIELFINAIQMSDKKGIVGLLLLFIFIIISNFENIWLKGIGFLGALIVLAIFILQKDPVEDIEEQLVDSNKIIKNNTKKSVLGESYE